VPLNFFGSTGTITRFGERFRDGQLAYSLVSFLFPFTVPPCPAICKSGGTTKTRHSVVSTGPPAGGHE